VTRDTYHHGDLRQALLETTADLIAAEGTSGFSLRKVARLAGVSPSAPAHHFRDSRGLISALAAEGYQALIDAFEATTAAVEEPYARLEACCRAYVTLAINNPGHMAVMFRPDLVDEDNVDIARLAPESLARFNAVVAAAIASLDADADLENATKTIWATCHGIANLYRPEGDTLDTDPWLKQLVNNAALYITIAHPNTAPANSRTSTHPTR
jgi:AcrR family transcriptional regulator